jgi:lysozyme
MILIALEIAITLIKRFEGCRLHAYRDIVGVWTIGWGETLGVGPGMVWTQDYADSRLRLRVKSFMLAVLKECPGLVLEQNKLAACTCLAYNIGMGGFRASSVKRLTNRKEWARAGQSFLLWNKAGGKVVNGLTRRRASERVRYLTEMLEYFTSPVQGTESHLLQSA